jgi:hypothetical protein
MRSAAQARVDSDGFVRGVCGAPQFNKPGISAEGQAFFDDGSRRRQTAPVARPIIKLMKTQSQTAKVN